MMNQSLLNKKTEFLFLATSHIAHLCNQFNYVFTLLVYMPCFKRNNFYQNRPKCKLFLQKNTKFLSPSASRLLKQPPIVNFWLYAPASSVYECFQPGEKTKTSKCIK